MYTEKIHAEIDRAAPARLPALPTALAWLVFQAGDERFAVDVETVCECVRHSMLGSVSGENGIVDGVALWRGKIVPFVDLRAAGSPLAGADIILFALTERVIAVAVDGALEVVTLAPWQIDPVKRRPGEACDGLLGSSIYGACPLLLVDIEFLLCGAAAPHAA